MIRRVPSDGRDEEIIIRLAASSENQGSVCRVSLDPAACKELKRGWKGRGATEESCEMQLCGFGNRRVLERPTLDCTRAEGRASPSRKEWLARHEVLVSVVGVHFRPPRGMQILTTCCRSQTPVPGPLSLFIFFARALQTTRPV